MAKGTGDIFGQSIIGRTIEDGWYITDFIGMSEDKTGGSYSLLYKVDKDGQQGFMKVYDFQTYREKNPNMESADIQRKMLDHYCYERDLHQICNSGYFDKVCYAIGAGTIKIVVAPEVELPAHYLIFDRAEGDMNDKLYAISSNTNSGWKFRMLHDLAVAMKQLYMGNIYHQDIKPSNVLCFPEENYKAGDLGRSFISTRECPFSSEPFWGDRRYMAPEISYQLPFSDLKFRAQMTDLFLFGSLTLQTFCGISYSSALYKKLDRSLHPGGSVTYVQAFPALQEEHIKIIREMKDSLDFQEEIKSRLTDCVAGLCNPDLAKRCHPQFNGLKYNHLLNLEKIISTFDYLERRLKLQKR